MILIPIILTVSFLLAQPSTGMAVIDSISTRSTRAEGILKCGNMPASNVYIRLFKINSDELSDALATAKTDNRGHFIIEGNTANYQGTEANIDPFIKIYHKCDDPEGKSGYRRLTLRFPREYVTIGKIPRRNYNTGTLNLQFQYPNEVRVDEIKGIERNFDHVNE